MRRRAAPTTDPSNQNAPGSSAGPGLGRLPVSRSARTEICHGVPGPRLQQEWDELAVESEAVPWIRPGWVVPWWASFGRAPALLCGRSPSGELTAALPLQVVRGALLSPTNWHTPELGVVAADEQARRQLLERALTSGANRLTLDFIGPALAEELSSVARRAGGRSCTRVLESSPYIEFGPGWTSGLDRHLLAELRRRERRLTERGEVVLELADGQTRLSALLAEAFTVEASGWKGRQGTAIASSACTRTFYERVAQWAAREGLLRLAFLRVDGRALGVDLAIEHGGVQYLLKTGYDESARACAPGKLLRWKVLEDCAVRGLSTYELLGHVQAWKHDWTPLRRDRLQAHAFPSTAAGRRAWAVHAKGEPAARAVRDRLAVVVDRVRGARSGRT